MSDINKGVLIFNEWFEAMKVLSMEERAQLIYAMYDFQINNIPPPKFSSVADSLATIFFKCIENRKVQSRRGLMSAAARLAKQEEASADRSDDVDSTVGKAVDSTVGNQSKVKKNKIEYSYNKAERRGADAPAAKEQGSFDLDDFFEAAVRRSLGEASE